MGTGVVIGYDPGGDRAHGLALLTLENGCILRLDTRTCETTEAVIRYVENQAPLLALGVDTLTCWSSGGGGWRPADRWLRQKYPSIQKSVMTPNGLAGSMGLNGMSLLLSVRAKNPSITVIETHPKVLYWALKKKKYNYAGDNEDMDRVLSDATGIAVKTSNEHEWDAAISAFAAVNGLLGCWTNDLHALPTGSTERLVTPCGATNYFWPES